jgi:hypothetical protein
MMTLESHFGYDIDSWGGDGNSLIMRILQIGECFILEEDTRGLKSKKAFGEESLAELVGDVVLGWRENMGI